MPSESPQENGFAYSDTQEVTGPPEYITPVMEQGPQYFPYRGIEQHGVAPTGYPTVDDGPPEDAAVVGVYAPPEEDVNPVPVRIVKTAVHEYQSWKAWQVILNATSPVLVAGRKDGRSNLRVRNFSTQGTNRVWIGPDANASAYTGYPLSGNDEVIFSGEAPVYGIADTGTVTLAVLAEFSTGE